MPRPSVMSAGAKMKLDGIAGKKLLSRVIIEPSDNGGATVHEEYAMKHGDPMRGNHYLEPVRSTFDNPSDAVKHASKCLGCGDDGESDGEKD